MADEFIFDTASAIEKSDKFRFGVNILYWIDTKSDWGTFDISKTLAELGVEVLRFPGGEASNCNYCVNT